MKIVKDYPPNILAIDAHFHTIGKPILYTYGETIYNPLGIHIPDFLAAHEFMHVMQQKKIGGPELWWKKYIEDQEFRYGEELQAHRTELSMLLSEVRDRNAKAKLVMAVAARLVAPLYGYSNKKLLEAQRELQRS